jgi:hypothetical protein
MTTKTKTRSFGRFAKQNKKDLQVTSPPLRGEKIKIKIIRPSQSMENKPTISTPPPLQIVTKN